MNINLDQTIPNLLDSGKPIRGLAPRISCDKCGNVILDGKDRDLDFRFIFIEAMVGHKSRDPEEAIAMRKLSERFFDMGGEIAIGPGDLKLIKTALSTYTQGNHVKGAVLSALREAESKEIED